MAEESERKLLATARAARAAWFVGWFTIFTYPLTFFFFITSIMALGSLQVREDNWFVGLVDFLGFFGGGAISAFAFCFVVSGLLAIFGFIVLNAAFYANRVSPYPKGISYIIAPACFVLAAVPITAVFPWFLVWSWHVVKNQTEDKDE